MSIAKGITLGSTEQVTNTKLHNLVDQATISLEYSEVANNILTSLSSLAGQLKPRNHVTSLASGALIRHDGAGSWYASMS
jgi:hypothetical protein